MVFSQGSHDVLIRCWPGLRASEGLTQPEELHSRWRTNMTVGSSQHGSLHRLFECPGDVAIHEAVVMVNVGCQLDWIGR